MYRRLPDRRDLFRLGSVALGTLCLPDWTAALERRGSRGRARACILLYMDGGPSHIDLWDLKPEAPVEVRGPFQPIRSSVPGVLVCEHLPRMAQHMHRLTQVRSVRHSENVHDPAVYQMLTGHKHPSSAGGLTVQPADFPQLGCAFGRLDRAPAVMPKVIELPETMRMEARILPGQNAGFLGAAHDPLRVRVTADAQVIPPDFRLRDDLPPARLRQRASLLECLDARLEALAVHPPGELARFHEQALALLRQAHIRQAFDLVREAPGLRDRYGRQRHGQAVLLARRLVEAGARFVTVYWGKEDQDWADGRGPRPANNPWDTHRNHFPLLRESLLPRADQALAALLSDLDERGLASDTLVVWMGDFGRTPRIERRYASRDHWPGANTVLVAGAGVPRGGVIGRTDRLAAEVTADPVTPADLAATIYHLLGLDPAASLHDTQGRPWPLCEGTALEALVS